MRMTENQLLGALDPRRQFDVKVRFPPSEKVGFICLNGSPLMMKNAFYFNLKAPFFLIIFKFYLEFFWSKKWFIKVVTVYFKILNAISWETIIKI